jgi:hypothetical protein
MKYLLFCIFLFLTACASAPADVGFGVHQQLFTPSGVLAREGQHVSTAACEIWVRQGWSKLAAAGLVSKCSSVSRAKELPVISKLSSQQTSEELPLAFDSMAHCVAWRNETLTSDAAKKVSDLKIDLCSKAP